MTYDSLVLLIQKYANRIDEGFTEVIPDLITFAINRIYSEAKHIGFERVAGNNDGFPLFKNGDPFIQKPTDWKETISFSYLQPVNGGGNRKIYLSQRTYEFCIAYWPLDYTVKAPLFYANYGNQTGDLGNQGKSFDKFYIAPTPDADYKGELIYLGLPIFDRANQTNFLTQRYPQLLLYACMVEAIPYVANDERIRVFESEYERALRNINQDTSSRYTDRTSMRDKD